ncbi:hypothetical protein GN156_03910 [bacterium LRH843]|nr:hypothetical protein [bacterium LRH843]
MINMEIEITEEKLRKLMPIFESILSRKHGRVIKFKELTMGDITVSANRSDENSPSVRKRKIGG